MAFRKRTVNGTVVDAAGNPITGAAVKFKLTTPLGYAATHVVVDREFTTTTDNAGAFSIALWCDEDSLAAVNYVVTFPIADDGQPDASHHASFSLAYDDGSTIQIGTLIAMGLPSPTPTELLYQLIDARVANKADKAAVRVINGSSATVLASDAGNFLRFTNAGANQLIIPPGLGADFNFAVVQAAGAGAVTFAAGIGVSMLNIDNHTKTRGPGAVVSFYSFIANEFVFQGATA